MDYKKINLLTLNGGAVPELFNEALQKVLKNIADPNTDNEKVREINIKIKIKPAKERTGGAGISIGCDTKLAGPKANAGMAIITIEDDEVVAYTVNPDQPEFPAVVDMENAKLNAMQKKLEGGK